MKELLEALAKFAQRPEETGDNLFQFFFLITSMEWSAVVAAGCAINALKNDAYARADAAKAAGTAHEYDALKDPAYLRLKSCLVPAVARVARLIAEAPKEQQGMLIHSVSGRDGFVGNSTVKEWQKTLGIAE